MANISYVFPNVCEISQRGGLLERWQLAKNLECDYIEVPGDFIKNKTEMEKTGLNLGDFLTLKAVRRLYKKDRNIPQELKYVLHTEPSLTRHDGYGMVHKAPLKWYDNEWVEKFVNMVISISKFFGMPATAIEVHPGDRRNSFKNITRAVKYLLDTYNEEFRVEPLILIENRTGQFISSGKNILSFWRFLCEKCSNLKTQTGIVLDVQQLYTVTKMNFLKELEIIPPEALKGFHIHYRHRAPNHSNEIPWKSVFNKIAMVKNNTIINPEIHHQKNVKDVIKFCEAMLHGSSEFQTTLKTYSLSKVS